MHCFKDNVILSIKSKQNSDNVCNFLTKITTNVINEDKDCIYACILTPKGRFLLDIFIYPQDKNHCIVEIHNSFLVKFQETLLLYDIMEEFNIQLLLDYIAIFSKDILSNEHHKNNIIDNIFIKANDPRRTNFGTRIICNKSIVDEYISNKDNFNYNRHRILHCICEGHSDLTPEKSIIIEFDFENLNAINFNKGCYPGQELITRAKHLLNVKKNVICLQTNLPPQLNGESILQMLNNLRNNEQLLITNQANTIDVNKIYNLLPLSHCNDLGLYLIWQAI